MDRRNFIKLAMASSLTSSLTLGFAKRAHAGWVGAIIAVAAAIASYVASRGNPTTSLLLSNAQSLDALNKKLDAIATQIANVTIEISNIYKELKQLDLKLDQQAENELIGVQHSIIQLIHGERRSIEAGNPVNPKARYESVKDLYLEYILKRNTLISQSLRGNFSSVPIIALSHRFELDVLNYILEKNVKLEISEYSIEDVIETIGAYTDYFTKALSLDNENSISRSSISAQTAYQVAKGRYEAGISHATTHYFADRDALSVGPEAGEYKLGCTIEKSEFLRYNDPEKLSNDDSFKRTGPATTSGGVGSRLWENPVFHANRADAQMDNLLGSTVCEVTFREVIFVLSASDRSGIQTFDILHNSAAPVFRYGDTITERRYARTYRNQNPQIELPEFGDEVCDPFDHSFGSTTVKETKLFPDTVSFDYSTFAQPPDSCIVERSRERWTDLNPSTLKISASEFTLSPKFEELLVRPDGQDLRRVEDAHAHFVAFKSLEDLCALCLENLECTSLVFSGDASCILNPLDISDNLKVPEL